MAHGFNSRTGKKKKPLKKGARIYVKYGALFDNTFERDDGCIMTGGVTAAYQSLHPAATGRRARVRCVEILPLVDSLYKYDYDGTFVNPFVLKDKVVTTPSAIRRCGLCTVTNMLDIGTTRENTQPVLLP